MPDALRFPVLIVAGFGASPVWNAPGQPPCFPMTSSISAIRRRDRRGGEQEEGLRSIRVVEQVVEVIVARRFYVLLLVAVIETSLERPSR